MLAELVAILWAPFLMCLVLTGIHAYLGVHVLAREVVFVDIAMAQIAALGATAAFLVGYEVEHWQSYAYSLGATLIGALVLSITRSRRRHVSQEAVIGIVYAASSAGAVLLADRAPHGAEQVRTMLVGNLLAVRPPEVIHVALLYGAIGVVRPGDLRYQGSDGNGRLRVSEANGRVTLRFLRDEGGVDAVFT